MALDQLAVSDSILEKIRIKSKTDKKKPYQLHADSYMGSNYSARVKIFTKTNEPETQGLPIPLATTAA